MLKHRAHYVLRIHGIKLKLNSNKKKVTEENMKEKIGY